MRYRAAALAVLVVLAGCAGLGGDATTDTPATTGGTATTGGGTDTATGTGTTADGTTTGGTTADGTTADGTTTAPAGDGERPDPDSDRLGWEGGYWYDDPLRVNATDGYDDAELDRVTARAMARIERIRGLEFERSVPVEVLTPAEFREQQGPPREPTVYGELRYEALFVVGENRSVREARAAVGVGVPAGRYDLNGDRILLVNNRTGGDNRTDGGNRTGTDRLRMNRGVLVHELVHALQNQRGYYTRARASGADSTDEFAGVSGVFEGDATEVAGIYEDRCGTEWDCVPSAGRSRSGSEEESAADLAERPRTERGILTLINVFYVGGEAFVEAVREREGWAGVDGLYGEFPESSEQLVHPARYPDDFPGAVSVTDRSSSEWRPLSRYGEVADTVGEGGLYAMLFANGVVPEGHDPLNYSLPATTGWDGDALVAYVRANRTDGRDVGAGGDDYAYVWRIRWESAADAEQFLAAYRAVLDRRGARELEGREGVYRIDDGPFADALRVTRDGEAVVVVNAPTVGVLDEVHPER